MRQRQREKRRKYTKGDQGRWVRQRQKRVWERDKSLKRKKESVIKYKQREKVGFAQCVCVRER